MSNTSLRLAHSHHLLKENVSFPPQLPSFLTHMWNSMFASLPPGILRHGIEGWVQTGLQETGGKRKGTKVEGFVDWAFRNVFGRVESKIQSKF